MADSEYLKNVKRNSWKLEIRAALGVDKRSWAEIQAEMEQAAQEEADETTAHLESIKPAAKRPPKPANLPHGSLNVLAKLLKKNSRQVRRYCEDGLVPGAKRTKGGHWRVQCTKEVVAQTKKAISGFCRKPKLLQNYKRFKRECGFDDDQLLDDDELPLPREIINKLDKMSGGHGTRHARLWEAFNELQKRVYIGKPTTDKGPKFTYTAIAEQMQVSRSTLFNWFTPKDLKMWRRMFQAGDTSKYFDAWDRNRKLETEYHELGKARDSEEEDEDAN